MSEPAKSEEPKKEGEEEEGKPSVNFLKVDRTLRPEGLHFEAEGGKPTIAGFPGSGSG